jgi:hypothetical protein
VAGFTGISSTLYLPLSSHIPDGYPIHAGGFHGHCWTLRSFSHCQEPLPILSKGAEDGLFALHLAIAAHPAADANADGLFVYIHTCAAAI